MRVLFVGSVHDSVMEKDLDELFGKYGKIIKIKLLRGYAFIEYDQHEDAEEAYKKCHNVDLKGEKINVEWAKGRKREFRCYNCDVPNARHHQEEALEVVQGLPDVIGIDIVETQMTEEMIAIAQDLVLDPLGEKQNVKKEIVQEVQAQRTQVKPMNVLTATALQVRPLFKYY
ncbi:Nucleotide-binding, alpha-beta plait domain-containing protein [Rozella allomycis CSF55]|uniref:Nucleotide-binding, alpha-beta plait domain-containing protein n=1 Tax=Rozella allomycis (strain CSF55) TaxID=988480 RepID=A0A075AXS4_ROZAC|nr:Nucleotide-binding, alpha-beta plait domain-containing protein [Rozella allomycis CSF55]|eukprot:EPZ35075.1 Nucleotide-binding, alpha-beta plait domain-containing protein [Rozella allomycis CSF55]